MPCGQRFAFRRPDGAIVVRQQPCRVKACEACGPRLRAKWASQWAHAMAGEVVYRLVVADGDLQRLRRLKSYQGQELGHIPAPDGKRIVYTTAQVGARVVDKIGSLTSDFAAMPNDRRRRFLSPGWAQVIADMDAEATSKREPWTCLGRVGRSLAQVAIVAEELGLLVGRTTDMVILRDPGDGLLEDRLFALIRLHRGRRRREAA
jgi:hypothetical protein